MTKIPFDSKNFRGSTEKLLNDINDIVEEYEEKGLKLTLRQIFYQLVTRKKIQNMYREYKRVGSALTKGRMAGRISWEAIIDPGRKPIIPQEFENLEDLLNVAMHSYRLDRWKDQKYYVEVWVEKMALQGILKKVASDHHVVLLADRGYNSTTGMFEARKRLLAQRLKGKSCVILYLGDHDPSGVNMFNDIQKRLLKLRCNLELRRIGLTIEQIEKYHLPPDPTKKSDTRAKKYISEYGDKSWELDALEPEVLINLVGESLEDILDRNKYQKVIEKEEQDKKKLQKCIDKMGKSKDGDAED